MSALIAAKPIAEGLTLLLQEKSAAIDTECERFLTVGDVEALHDLRVAMRRLHTLFAGFASCFSEERTLPKRLRSLQKESNTARDIEVTLALVERLELDLPQLQQQWQKDLADEYRRLRETIPPAWQALSLELDHPQDMFAENLPEMPLGAYAATLAGAEEKRLLQKMNSLGNKWKKRRAHKLRITGKRVRYLLEPFAEESASAAKAVATLKQFQDLLGDYHDIVVLRQKLCSLGGDGVLSDSEQLERARRRLKKAQRRLRKSYLRQYRVSGKLHQTIEKACHDLAQP